MQTLNKIYYKCKDNNVSKLLGGIMFIKGD